VKKTYANIDRSAEKLDYKPQTNIDEGIKRFIKWYKLYTTT